MGHGRKFTDAQAKIDRARHYSPSEAIETVKSVAFSKFDETVDVAVHLGVDPRHADQIVRGTVVLPHGTGTVNVVAGGLSIPNPDSGGATLLAHAALDTTRKRSGVSG